MSNTDQPHDAFIEDDEYVYSEDVGSQFNFTSPNELARQSKPLTEQSLVDFDAFFMCCPGLTYIFASDQPEAFTTAWPNVVSALVLALSALHQWPHIPYGKDAILHDALPLTADEVSATVQLRVSEMERRRARFTLVWVVSGDDEVHVEGDWESLADDVAGLVSAEVDSLLTL